MCPWYWTVIPADCEKAITLEEQHIKTCMSSNTYTSRNVSTMRKNIWYCKYYHIKKCFFTMSTVSLKKEDNETILIFYHFSILNFCFFGRVCRIGSLYNTNQLTYNKANIQMYWKLVTDLKKKYCQIFVMHIFIFAFPKRWKRGDRYKENQQTRCCSVK